MNDTDKLIAAFKDAVECIEYALHSVAASIDAANPYEQDDEDHKETGGNE